ncbi:MAG: lipopolysaccharide heptosyltransferase II, partial [Legionellales bacterium]
YGLLNNIYKLDKQQLPLMVQRFVALAYKNIEAMSQNLQAVWPVLQPQQVTLDYDKSKPILALCPGAAFGPAKMWPLKHFAAVANKKIQDGWQVWIFGSTKDIPLATAINGYTNNQCISYAGAVDLAQAIDLLALSAHVVTNDSGLMHIAAALGLSISALYGATSSAFTPPLSNTAKIFNLNLSCSPCFKRTCPLQHHNCMEQLLPETVCEF